MTRSVLFLIVSAVCFAVALLADLSVVASHPFSWAFAGALAYVVSCLP